MVSRLLFAVHVLVLIHGLVGDENLNNRRHLKKTKPNIVIIMTDDQDIQLGSMNYMPKTLKIFQEGGASFTNTFTNSPICCPSRSSFLTGLHVHNHNVWTNNENCSSEYWRNNFEIRSFATYLRQAGYKTGYFGKYLNEYDGSHIPAGWREWMGLLKNSAFYNYTVNFNGRLIKHKNDYHKDYFTDLIANDSVTFFKQSKLYHRNKPIAMVLSMPAPHGPEDSAPQYADMFHNITDHRTPSWNYAPNPDKEYLLQITGKMEPIQSHFTDLLMRKRVMTLQSVDDAVEKVYNELINLGELNNTYMIYLSDHGYHLGQFGISKGKSMPYDFDTRIPLYIRGPGIKPGSTIKNLAGIIDIAPTLLEIAGVEIPDNIDGRSLKPLLDDSERGIGFVQRKAWRDTYLIERGKMRKKLIESSMEDMTENFLPIYFTGAGRLENKCEKPKYQYPCRQHQKYFCYKDVLGRKRIRKCNKLTRRCSCNKIDSGSSSSTPSPGRIRRQIGDGSYVQKCSIVNDAVRCSRIESDSFSLNWNQQKLQLNNLIKEYRQQLNKLKELREDMQENIGNVDIDKYRLSTTKQPPTSAALDVFNVSQPENNLEVTVEDEKDCFCLDEDSDFRYKSEPEDLMSDKEPESVSKASGVDKLTRREQKRLERQWRREEKKRERQKKRHVLCDDNDRKCMRRRKKKLTQLSKRNNPHCKVEGAECSIMDNDHWKTEPRWTMGPFCFCNNAQSNVFWCLRTINETHNFLYCEYIHGFLSYYDVNKDPYMLRNAIHDLPYIQLSQLHELLAKMRRCKGSKECTYRYRQKSTSTPSSIKRRRTT